MAASNSSVTKFTTTTVALPQNGVGAPRPLYASGTDSLGKPAQPSDPVAAFMGMGVHQNAKCNCSITHDEIDCLRPRVYEELAKGAEDDLDSPTGPGVRMVKVHDAYTLSPLGEPLLGGAKAAQGAIVIVRDPRDVAPSLAHHSHQRFQSTPPRRGRRD